MKPSISTHFANDDLRHYSFVRDSRLPIGTFPRGSRISPDAIVFAACIVLGGLVLVLL